MIMGNYRMNCCLYGNFNNFIRKTRFEIYAQELISDFGELIVETTLDVANC